MKKILIKACTNGNLGDDLFVRGILERYKTDKVRFYLLVYDIRSYQYLLDEYRNLVLIKYPIPFFPLRVLAKCQEKVLKKYGIKQYAYEKAYSKLNKKSFDIFINIGGSQFAEYKNEKFILSLFLEAYMAENINARDKFLFNINFGPFISESFRKACLEIFKGYRKVIFRDKYSKKLFPELKNTTYAPDIALSIDYKEWGKEKGNLASNTIYINVVNLRSNLRVYEKRKKYIEQYETTIKEVIIRILKKGVDVCILGFSQEYQEEQYIDKIILEIAGNETIGRLTKFIYNGKNIKEVVERIKVCRGLLATRFHAMILGLVFGKVQYPICYDDKLLHFLESIEYKGAYSNLSNLENSEKIAEILMCGNDFNNYKSIILESRRYFEELDKYM